MKRRGALGVLFTVWKVFCYSLGTLCIAFVAAQLWFLGRIVYWNSFNPSSSSFMESRLEQMRVRDRNASLQQRWVGYEEISVHLKRAVVAAEDARFLDHEGFDWGAIQKAMLKNEKEGKVVAGASTISQQLAKNLFLSGHRSWLRKGQEAILTWMLERVMSKRRILEIYLNVAEWGDGVFGAEAAARFHLGRPASALGPEQAAYLAVILPSPRRYDRGRITPYVAGRASTILSRMRAAQIPELFSGHESRSVSEVQTRLEVEDLQENLREVQELLLRQKLVEGIVHRQEMPRHDLVERLVHKQHLSELRAKLERLHPADIAFILEALPLAERLEVWDLVKADRDGEILLEVSDAVRESLIANMDSEELVAAAETLEADELADIAADLPPSVIEEVVQSLPMEERERLRSALSYPDGTVGALMDFDHVAVREDVTLEAATRYLRRLDELPDHTDQLFVVDRDQKLTGTMPLSRLIVSDLHLDVASVLVPENVKLYPEDSAEDAASAFERYDLVSAPVVDGQGRLIGRLTVDAVVDYIRQRSNESQLAEAGLRHEEDIFAPVLDSFKNRWSWLAINLVTAFIASRVIGAFEDSIGRLVALAALMPIVAGIGGNSGNQTTTMIVRALALGQIQREYWLKLVRKELGVALLNGVVWGTLLGVVAYAFYGRVALGGVMALAMLLNLLLAAVMGVAIPWIRARLGRDPAVGSSVLITACTDSGGFFIFLGLATVFLM